MTFEQLLDLSASKLQALSDQELLQILGPCLVNTPPIDIQILQKEKDELDKKKEEIKLNKKQEKLEAKLSGLDDNQPPTEKKLSKSKRAELADMIKIMNSKLK